MFCLLASAVLLFAGCSGKEDVASPPDTPAGQQDGQANHNEEEAEQPGEPPKKIGDRQYDKPPAMQIDTSKTYKATVDTTAGTFTIQLFAKDAPKTVNNFIFLAKEKFYDGLTFHRIIKNFMIQTGDPKGDGTGGPGYTFEDELDTGHKYEIGVVAMANAGKDTNGSQFFIGTGEEVSGLNNFPHYTIFGKVIKGMDVVQKIAAGETKNNPHLNENSAPVNPVKIKSITIQEG
ncbi:MAG: peptidylprolyl isomerase [Brevibacillus sp.]|nr:peptidylprolyl isomerase [Brevibacillus sp.]